MIRALKIIIICLTMASVIFVGFFAYSQETSYLDYRACIKMNGFHNKYAAESEKYTSISGEYLAAYDLDFGTELLGLAEEIKNINSTDTNLNNAKDYFIRSLKTHYSFLMEQSSLPREPYLNSYVAGSSRSTKKKEMQYFSYWATYFNFAKKAYKTNGFRVTEPKDTNADFPQRHKLIPVVSNSQQRVILLSLGILALLLLPLWSIFLFLSFIQKRKAAAGV